jgi:hypothetical protein
MGILELSDSEYSPAMSYCQHIINFSFQVALIGDIILNIQFIVNSEK